MSTQQASGTVSQAQTAATNSGPLSSTISVVSTSSSSVAFSSSNAVSATSSSALVTSMKASPYTAPFPTSSTAPTTPVSITPTSASSEYSLFSAPPNPPSSSSSSTISSLPSHSSPSSASSLTSSFSSSSQQSALNASHGSTQSSIPPASSGLAVPNSGQVAPGGGLSTGAKAGIAVGVVGAFVILGVVLALTLRRRSRRQRQQYSNGAATQILRPPHPKNEMATEKAFPIAGIWPASSAPEREVLLPQQADDATIRSRFSTLYDQIELHIENFYNDASPVIPPANEGALSRYDTSILAGPLVGELEQCPRAITLLKHVLCYEIFATTVWPTPGKQSLLPDDLISALKDSHNSEHQANDRGKRAPSIQHLLACAFANTTPAISHLQLLATKYRHNLGTAHGPQSNASARHFTSVFALWSNPSYSEERRTQHLTEVMNSAVDFAVWLFSHPDRFEFQWKGDAHGDGSRIATVPALVKVMHDGQPMARVQVLCEVVYGNM